MASLLMVGLLAGCDSVSGNEGDAVVSGVVTDDAGYGKQAARIEGAVVTAARVDASGATSALSAQATTNANGAYTLALEGAGDHAVVTASKGAFNSRVLVALEGEGRVRALPMTTESRVEADVFVEARQGSSNEVEAGWVTPAFVAAHVDQRAAVSVASGAATTTSVAAAIRAAAVAQREVVRDDAGDDAAEEAEEREHDAYLRLQADVEAGADASAAMASFEEALLEAYAEAGVEAKARARAHQAARAALVRFSSNLSSEARFALRQRAEVFAGAATASAIEASFAASGASSARLATLAEARAQLIASLRASADAAAVAAAQATYENEVEAAMEAEFGVSTSEIAAAALVIGTLQSTLNTSVSLAARGGAIATAYNTFYANAESAARAQFSGADANAAATVLVLLTAF